MKILQLFRRRFKDEDLQAVLKCYNIESLERPITFTKKDLQEHKTIQQIESVQHILQEYYLPCKYKVYVSKEMNLNSAINILRQICRLYNCTLTRYTKDVNKEKLVLYTIKRNGEFNTLQLNRSTSNILVEFD